MADDFCLMDCALITISTGEQAQNLRELRDRLEETHPGCIYYHFWGGMLRHRYVDPEYQNDFAVWAWHGLHDQVLAEKLSLIDPNVYQNLEEVRRELIEIIEAHLYEREHVPWARNGEQFFLIRSQIVVFDTGIRISHPAGFAELIPRMTPGSIFYHFIDARRRTTESMNDFSLWLSRHDEKYTPVIEMLNSIDPYFTTLSNLRDDIAAVFSNLPGGE